MTRYLDERGVTGIDLAPGTVEVAHRRNPGIEFTQGDMLPMGDGAFADIVAFYSLIHFTRREVVTALLELKRVLRPGGVVLLAFHIGDQPVHLDEWWGQPVSLDFEFFLIKEVTGMLLQAGFSILQCVERDPYPGVEHLSRRAYLLAVPRP